MSKGEKDGEEPKVVSLVRGVVHAEVLRWLRCIMAELHRDPVLDVAAATGLLWGVASDLFSPAGHVHSFAVQHCPPLPQVVPDDVLAFVLRVLAHAR